MSSLAERYGTRTPLKKRWWVLGITTAALVFGGWVAWVNFGFATVETRDISNIYDPERREMAITWSVTVAPGTPVACAIQALNSEFQVVGWKIVDIPADTEYTRQFSENVRTAMPPQAGLVYACWAS
ncbi:MAG TPA: DUF4307 domain-containing protein [Microbacteriaceae bacterium]|nr:DUF4307 domain-containing protein [Microbacteriaceae bacterium]